MAYIIKTIDYDTIFDHLTGNLASLLICINPSFIVTTEKIFDKLNFLCSNRRRHFLVA